MKSIQLVAVKRVCFDTLSSAESDQKIISNGFDATDVRQHVNKINKDLILAINIFISFQMVASLSKTPVHSGTESWTYLRALTKYRESLARLKKIENSPF